MIAFHKFYSRTFSEICSKTFHFGFHNSILARNWLNNNWQVGQWFTWNFLLKNKWVKFGLMLAKSIWSLSQFFLKLKFTICSKSYTYIYVVLFQNQHIIIIHSCNNFHCFLLFLLFNLSILMFLLLLKSDKSWIESLESPIVNTSFSSSSFFS